MVIKYPSLWKKDYFESPFINGHLTLVATEWFNQLTGLSPKEIVSGVNKLSDSDFKVFPPNAMSFRYLCNESALDSVVDDILSRLLEGSTYQFENQLAFNFWMANEADLKTARHADVEKLIKRRIGMIDKSCMYPLPNYSIPVIEHKEPEPTHLDIATEREVIIFQSHMTKIIFDFNHRLFRSGKLESVSTRTFNREPAPELPPLMQKIFSRQGTLDLIKKFKEKGFFIPQVVQKPHFQVGVKTKVSTEDYKAKRQNYLETIRTSMIEFLTQENILT